MRELTGQRIATGALMAIMLTVICYWGEPDTTKVMTMLTLYGQTGNPKFAALSVDVARASVIPSLFNYTRGNETDIMFSSEYELSKGEVTDLREREVLVVNVTQELSEVYTLGLFDDSQITTDHAKVELATTILILIVWILAVASFAGPVMTLVSYVRSIRCLSLHEAASNGVQFILKSRLLSQ